MPNPNPGLRGWADPEEPDWRDRLLEALREQQRTVTTRRANPRQGSFQVYSDPEFVALVRAAAKRRDMTLASYVRRAVAAWVAKDLGLPYPEVTKYCPKPRPDRSGGTRTQEPDDGTGYGSWDIA